MRNCDKHLLFIQQLVCVKLFIDNSTMSKLAQNELIQFLRWVKLTKTPSSFSAYEGFDLIAGVSETCFC